MVKTSKTLAIRQVETGDREFLLRWRNDPRTRKNSRNEEPILPAEHNKWFETLFGNHHSLQLIGIDGAGKPLGQVRFDMDSRSECAEVSISVAPEERGKGLGKKLLSLACGYIFKKTSVKTLKAAVKKGNGASVKLFKGFGFHELKEEDKSGLVYFEYRKQEK